MKQDIGQGIRVEVFPTGVDLWKTDGIDDGERHWLEWGTVAELVRVVCTDPNTQEALNKALAQATRCKLIRAVHGE